MLMPEIIPAGESIVSYFKWFVCWTRTGFQYYYLNCPYWDFKLKAISRISLIYWFSDSLSEYFGRYGEVIDCIVMKNLQTGKSRGFGFVTYKDPACVETVLSSGPHQLDGRQV